MAYTPFYAGQKATAQLLNTRLVELVMDWTDLDDIGNFGANFAASGTKGPRMRKIRELGTEIWEFEGMITASAFAANTTLNMFQLDSGYRVASEKEFAVGASTSAHYPVRLGLMSSGWITASVPTAAGTTTSVVWLDGARVTNPV